MTTAGYVGIDERGALRLAAALDAGADGLERRARLLEPLLADLVLRAGAPALLRSTGEDERDAARAVRWAGDRARSLVLRSETLLCDVVRAVTGRALRVRVGAGDVASLGPLVAAQLVLGLRPAATADEALTVLDGHRDRFDVAHEQERGDPDPDPDGFVSLDDLAAVAAAPSDHPAHLVAAAALLAGAAHDDEQVRRRFQRPSWWDRNRRLTHLGLDVAGLVPVVGNAADALNAGLYAAEGDWENATISLAGALPGGEAATGVRILDRSIDGARWAGRALDVRQTEAALADADSIGDVAKVAGLQAVSPALHHAGRATLRRVELDVHVRLRAAPLGVHTVAVGGRGLVPRGFADAEEFRRFGARLHTGLRDSGYRDVTPVMSGSASTGKSYLHGTPFDLHRRSDFDIGLASPTLLDAARRLDIALAGKGTRTICVPPDKVEALGLGDLQRALSELAGREVRFMVYESVDHQLARQGGTVIPPR